jgi:hypothetical protein
LRQSVAQSASNLHASKGARWWLALMAARSPQCRRPSVGSERPGDWADRSFCPLLHRQPVAGAGRAHGGNAGRPARLWHRTGLLGRARPRRSANSRAVSRGARSFCPPMGRLRSNFFCRSASGDANHTQWAGNLGNIGSDKFIFARRNHSCKTNPSDEHEPCRWRLWCRMPASGLAESHPPFPIAALTHPVARLSRRAGIP